MSSAAVDFGARACGPAEAWLWALENAPPHDRRIAAIAFADDLALAERAWRAADRDPDAVQVDALAARLLATGAGCHRAGVVWARGS